MQLWDQMQLGLYPVVAGEGMWVRIIPLDEIGKRRVRRLLCKPGKTRFLPDQESPHSVIKCRSLPVMIGSCGNQAFKLAENKGSSSQLTPVSSERLNHQIVTVSQTNKAGQRTRALR